MPIDLHALGLTSPAKWDAFTRNNQADSLNYPLTRWGILHTTLHINLNLTLWLPLHTFTNVKYLRLRPTVNGEGGGCLEGLRPSNSSLA